MNRKTRPWWKAPQPPPTPPVVALTPEAIDALGDAVADLDQESERLSRLVALITRETGRR